MDRRDFVTAVAGTLIAPISPVVKMGMVPMDTWPRYIGGILDGQRLAPEDFERTTIEDSQFIVAQHPLKVLTIEQLASREPIKFTADIYVKGDDGNFYVDKACKTT